MSTCSYDFNVTDYDRNSLTHYVYNNFCLSRNVNTIRSITKEHGDIVDRYKLMARSATRGAFVSPNASFIQRMRGRLEQLCFDYSLKYAALVKQLFPLSFFYLFK